MSYRTRMIWNNNIIYTLFHAAMFYFCSFIVVQCLFYFLLKKLANFHLIKKFNIEIEMEDFYEHFIDQKMRRIRVKRAEKNIWYLTIKTWNTIDFYSLFLYSLAFSHFLSNKMMNVSVKFPHNSDSYLNRNSWVMKMQINLFI